MPRAGTFCGSRRPIRHVGAPVSYEVDGTQYIAVQSGWGIDAQRIQDALAKQNNVGVSDTQGGVVWVFAVKQ